MNIKKYLPLALLLLFSISVFAQDAKKDVDKLTRNEVLEMNIEQLSDYDLEEMMKLMDIVGASSIEELYELLLNKDVTSASKSEENLFDSPLSTTVLSSEEILSSGATSIEEALKLVPGVIVREKTNGCYDVQIRGGQNMPMNNMLLYAENTTTLIMINNQPVFNYGMGGIIWESLPVSLGEIDRIEVVRGPSSALYGPNAVNGVISIITKDIESSTPFITANVQGGSQNTYIGDVNFNKKVSDKLAFGATGYYEYRDRNSDKIFVIYDNEYETLEQYDIRNTEEMWSTENPHDLFYDVGRAKQKIGVNGNIQFTPNESINLNLTGGYLESESNSSTYGDNPTPYALRQSYGGYSNLNAQIYGINLDASLTLTTQDFCQGHDGWVQDIEQYNASVDYLFNLNKLSIRPGISYQSVYFDDTDHISEIGEGYFNDKVNLNNFSLSSRFDYHASDKLRLVAALRAEKYSVPDKWMPTYQFIGSYKINENNLFRAVYSRANQSTFLLNAYSDYVWDRDGLGTPEFITFTGNPDPDMMKMDMIEIGFRSRPAKNLLLDIELFYNKSEDYSALMPDSTVTTTYMGDSTLDIASGEYTSTNIYMGYQSLDIKGKQIGLSVAADMVISSKLIAKAHFTWQKTTVDNFLDKNRDDIAGYQITDYYTDMITGLASGSPDASYNSDAQYDESYYTDNVKNEAIPSYWGSISLTYKASKKLDITMQGYYFDDYFLYSQYEEYATGQVDSKLTVNTKVNYKLNDNIQLYFNGRNILNNDKREYVYMDKIGGIYLVGFNMNF